MQCGSTKGIMPLRWKAKDGQIYHASPNQEILKAQWDEGWHIVKKLRKNGNLVIVSMGEAIDGNHHRTTQLVTSDIEEQKRMHIALMNEAMDIVKFNPKTDKMFYMDSTEVHTGGTEDAIARDFIDPKTGNYLVTPAIKPSYEGAKDGRFSRDILHLDVNGVLFNIAHHGFNGGTRAWTTSNSMRAVLLSHYLNCLNYDKPIPRYIIRSHIHRYIPARIDEPKGTIEGFTTPSFQYKTRHAFRNFGLDFGTIGMLYVVVEPDGSTWWDCPKLVVEDAEVEKI